MEKVKIILASKSAARIAILNQLGLNFESRPTFSREYTSKDRNDVEWLVRKNSELKLADFLTKNEALADKVVITADTLVMAGDKIIEKPKRQEEARELLSIYEKNEVQVFSSVCVHNPSGGRGRRAVGIDKSVLKMHRFSRDLREKVFNQVFSLDFSGGFSLEGWGAILFDNLNGSYYNVLGMPIHVLFKLFVEVGLDFFSFLLVNKN